MRYTLWSRGRPVGHTDLDLETVTATMRQGFVEPTEEGRALLADATGVWRAMAEIQRRKRASGERTAAEDALFLEAVERREDLELELRDEAGRRFECDHIRITDLTDLNAGIVDEMNDTEEEDEAEFQIHLSAMSGEGRDKALADRAEMHAEIESSVTEILADRAEAFAYGSAWPPPPAEDPRWESMQYLLQAHLRGGTGDWED